MSTIALIVLYKNLKAVHCDRHAAKLVRPVQLLPSAQQEEAVSVSASAMDQWKSSHLVVGLCVRKRQSRHSDAPLELVSDALLINDRVQLNILDGSQVVVLVILVKSGETAGRLGIPVGMPDFKQSTSSQARRKDLPDPLIVPLDDRVVCQELRRYDVER